MITIWTNQQVEAEIGAGARVCDRLKRIYYLDEKWGDVHADILVLFNEAKKRLSGYYPECAIHDLLAKMESYKDDDIKRLLAGFDTSKKKTLL